MQMGFRRTGCKIIQTKKFNFEIKHLTLTNRMELSFQDFQSSKEITIHFLMKSIQCPTEGSLMSKSNLELDLFMYFALTWSLLLMEYLQVIFLFNKIFFWNFHFFFCSETFKEVNRAQVSASIAYVNSKAKKNQPILFLSDTNNGKKKIVENFIQIS